MVFDGNWVVPVLHDGLMAQLQIDPLAKVEMQIMEPRQEPTETLCAMYLAYDPAFDVANLTTKMNEIEISERFFSKIPKSPTRISRSAEYRRFSEIFFDASHHKGSDDPAILAVRVVSNLATEMRLTSKEGIPLVSERPGEFLLHCLTGALNLRYWDDLAHREGMRTSRGSVVRDIKILLDRNGYEALGKPPGVEPFSSDNSYFVIAGRRVAA